MPEVTKNEKQSNEWVEYWGYKENAAQMPKNDGRVMLKALAENLKTKIKVVWKNGENTLGLEPDDMDFDGVVLYDYSTPLVDAGGPMEEGGAYWITNSNGLDGKFPKTNMGSWYLETNPWITKLPDEGSPDYEAFTTCPGVSNLDAGGYHTLIGTSQHRVIWLRTSLINFGMKVGFLRPAIEKAMDEGHWKDRMKKLADELEATFLKNVDSALKTEKKIQTDALTQIDEKIAVYDSNIIKLYKKRQLAANRVAFINDKASSEQDYYKGQLKEMMEHPRVTYMYWDSSTQSLAIDTDDIYMFSPNKKERALLGKFQIRLSQDGNIVMINKTRKRGGRMTPHVVGDGRPCWGSSNQAVRKLVAQGEYAALLEVCINYLEQYNPNDDQADVAAYWFTETETEVEVDGVWHLKKDAPKPKKTKKSKKISGEEMSPADVLTEEELV